jgi:hypothetical protein
MSVSQLIKTMGSRILLNMTLCYWMSGFQRIKDLNAFKTLETTPLSAQCHMREDLELQHLICDTRRSQHPLNCICHTNELQYSTNIMCWVTAIQFRCRWLCCFAVNVMLAKFPVIFQFTIIQIFRILHSKSWVWLSLELFLFPTHNFWDEIMIYYNVVIQCGDL